MRWLDAFIRTVAFACGWLAAHRGYRWGWVALCLVTLVIGRGFWTMVLLGWVVPVCAAVWATHSPVSYERWVAGPARRRSWRRWLTGNWPLLARQSGIARQVPITVKVRGRHGVERVERMTWQSPRLSEVRADARSITARIQCAPGQTVDELEGGLLRLATTAAVERFHSQRLGPNEVELTLMMLDELGWPTEAVAPVNVSDVGAVSMGRTATGNVWELNLRGRHTLVVGCSGAGKGSVLWGVCGGLAPAVSDDRVRLWGIDLKRGVELAMGRGLFSVLVDSPEDAVLTLRQLIEVIDDRGRAMAGKSRLHEPTPGDPLHVLVIDELAILTAYCDPAAAREANRLLGEILTQGRALGVVVLACVQDPRKEVVGLRGLFTQTVAMRLRSVFEVSMVLGEGMADRAPAHRISPANPGTAYVVDDGGQCMEVRADYWPDSLVKHVAHTFPTPVAVELSRAHDETPDDTTTASTPKRSPRKPRSPRRPRASTSQEAA